MGVRRKGQKTPWKVYIPIHVAAQVELALYNPLHVKPDYGLRSQLVTDLLTKWLADLRGGVAATGEPT
jgi:hypothetical protein